MTDTESLILTISLAVALVGLVLAALLHISAKANRQSATLTVVGPDGQPVIVTFDGCDERHASIALTFILGRIEAMRDERLKAPPHVPSWPTKPDTL